MIEHVGDLVQNSIAALKQRQLKGDFRKDLAVAVSAYLSIEKTICDEVSEGTDAWIPIKIAIRIGTL